jgi:MFS superfamily sulfate permease-like transporter
MMHGFASRAALARDLPASIVVFLVALPLCMGIAMASGLPPAKGLITGIVGGLVVGALAGAPLQVSGPAAGLAIIVLELVHEHGIAMLGPILILAGLMQLLAGAARLGAWFRAISPAVVYGMLAAIGVLIAASQLHVMFDASPTGSGLDSLLAIPETLWRAFDGQGGASATAGLVAAATIATMLGWEKLRPTSLRAVPGALVGVALATVLASGLDLPVKRVALPDDLLGALDIPGEVQFLAMLDGAILISAAVVAFVASAETLLSAAALDRMHDGPRAQYDRELAAQGIGNMLCGVLGALPMTGVIVRSSANVQAGAVSRLSAMLHGLWILLALVLVPGLLELVPTASLAAVLVLTGIKLVEVKRVRALAGYGVGAVVTYAVTLAIIVGTDLLTGVLAGIAVSLTLLAWQMSQLHVEIEEAPGEVRVSLAGTATFMRLPALERALHKVPTDRLVRLDTGGLHYVDHACLELLKDWARSIERRTARPPITDWDSLGRRSALAAT